MSELDDKIRESLRNEDADTFEDLDDEPSLFWMMTETFRGRNRRIMMLSAFWIFAFLVFGIFAAIKFFRADATQDMLMWALAVIVSISAVSMMKVMWWMDVNKNAITREIKRLEMRIARLDARIKDRD